MLMLFLERIWLRKATTRSERSLFSISTFFFNFQMILHLVKNVYSAVRKWRQVSWTFMATDASCARDFRPLHQSPKEKGASPGRWAWASRLKLFRAFQKVTLPFSENVRHWSYFLRWKQSEHPEMGRCRYRLQLRFPLWNGENCGVQEVTCESQPVLLGRLHNFFVYFYLGLRSQGTTGEPKWPHPAVHQGEMDILLLQLELHWEEGV